MPFSLRDMILKILRDGDIDRQAIVRIVWQDDDNRVTMEKNVAIESVIMDGRIVVRAKDIAATAFQKTTI